MKKKDIRQVAELKNSVFKKFNSSEYFEKKGLEWYLNFTNLNKTNEELLKAFHIENKPIFFIAEENGKVIGYIKGNKDKILNLFVSGKQHKKGIGKKLVEIFEKTAKEKGSNELKLKSMIFAIPFYEKIGFKKTTGIRNMNGLKIQPMKKIINS